MADLTENILPENLIPENLVPPGGAAMRGAGVAGRSSGRADANLAAATRKGMAGRAGGDGASLMPPRQPIPPSGVIEKVDNVVGAVGTATNLLNIAPLIVEVGLPVAGAAVAAPVWVAQKVVPKWAGAAGKVYDKVNTPGKLFYTATFGDVGNKMGRVGGAIGGGFRNTCNALGAVHLPNKLRDMSIGQAVFGTTMVAGAGLTTYGTVRSLGEDIKNLKQMYADLTGAEADKVATSTVLFGKVPEQVRVARGSLVKEFLPRTALSALNIFLGFRWLKKPPSGLVAPMMLNMGINMGSEFMGKLSESSLLSLYSEMRHAKASGQEITPLTYARFITALSPELAARGGIKSQFTQELALEMAKKQAGPADIVKMDIRAELATLYARQQQAAVQAPAPAAEAGKSHVAAVTAAKPQPGPVVGSGRFTGLLNKEAQAVPQQGLAAS